MPIYALGDRAPLIHETAFVHPDAVLIGAVTIGPESTVWPTTVLRGDHGEIRIGAATSIQDGTVIHCTSELDTVVGDRCTVGHRAHLEGCVIEDDCLIGSGSVILHRVVVRRGSLVGAAALLPNDFEVPAGSVAVGVPAKIRAAGVPTDLIEQSVATYVHNSHWYRAELRRIG